MQNSLIELILLVTMEYEMKKHITAMIILAMISTVVEAGTLYNVKVKNKNVKEGFNLMSVEVYGKISNNVVCSWYNGVDKGCYENGCSLDEWKHILLEGDAHQLTCSANGGGKWKRRIEVKFKCGEDGERYISFPRGKKWYDRNHLIEKDNRYVVKIKKSDC